jgi:glycosyltransferase involved in cell wall biosynthesis
MSTPLIAIDARAVRPGMTGVGRFTAQMLRAAVRRESGMRWGLFTNTPSFLEEQLRGDSPAGAPPRQLPSRVELWPVAVSPEAHPAAEWWLNVTLPRLLRARGAALFHGPAYAVPWRRLSIPTVLSVHDMAHRLHPPVHPLRFRLWLGWTIALGARAADRIVVGSPAAGRDVAAIYPQMHSKVEVIPYGVDASLKRADEKAIEELRARLKLPRRFLLHVGTFEPRKNHRFLLAVHGALRAEVEEPIGLVMAGAEGIAMRDVQRWIAESPWRESIHVLSGARCVADGDLAALYSAAEAFLFPSVSEGFGFPVLEALACGSPVLAALAPGIDQFSRSPAILLPTDAPQPWVMTLKRLLADSEKQSEVRRTGPECAATFSWDATAERLLDLYRSLLRG